LSNLRFPGPRRFDIACVGLAFDSTRSLGSTLVTWPREQVVKRLVSYHPDDEAGLRVAQEERLLELWEATRTSGHELPLDALVQGFAQATHPIVKGFMVGRTIWGDASRVRGQLQ